MSDAPDDVDRDFAMPDMTIYPEGFNPYRETLRVCDRIIALLDRIVSEHGVDS